MKAQGVQNTEQLSVEAEGKLSRPTRPPQANSPSLLTRLMNTKTAEKLSQGQRWPGPFEQF